MPYDTSQLEHLGDYKPNGSAPKNNSPNEDLMRVQEIQGLVSMVWGKLSEIKATTDKQKAVLSIAKEEINTYETTTLRELQDEFE